MTAPREREAILRCQDGDVAGLEVLFELHRASVLRTAYGIVGRRQLAEDVTQQVFVELFTAMRRFDPERPLAPWLYRIVVNISLKELRRRHHRTLPLDEVAADLPSLDPLPDLIAEESEVKRSMWTAIQSLSPKHRAAVVLRYYHGFSEAEMAVALGCRRGTVKSRLHSALRQLEVLLRESGIPERVLERERDAAVTCDAVQP
ncbi:MAG: sigma-70 family RNA polymerase sigma factor [Chloroflexi bacterium]|nr:sigma-70 family RNA polymerase sigma factor [Chloroflexota bacterium]